MNEQDRKRDVIWCRALVAILDVEQIADVTAKFNKLRPDRKTQPDDDAFRQADIKNMNIT